MLRELCKYQSGQVGWQCCSKLLCTWRIPACVFEGRYIISEDNYAFVYSSCSSVSFCHVFWSCVIRHVTVMSSLWSDLLIIMKLLSLSLVIFFVLKSILSGINIITSAPFWLLLSRYLFSYSFTFNLCVSSHFLQAAYYWVLLAFLANFTISASLE